MHVFALTLAATLAAGLSNQAASSPPTPPLSRPAIQTIDARTRAAIEAVALDYVDGQLEGDAARVTRALRPCA